jgi:translation initiation factor IF-2
MDKVKIQEIAEEAGLSNGDLLDKAKELGFDVKAANSTISMENAGVLVDYAISGTLPNGFTKPGDKPKITVVKKKIEAVKVEVEDTVPETVETTENVIAEESVSAATETKEKVVEETALVEETVVEETAVEETALEEEVVEKPAPKEIKKRKGISVVSKKSEASTAESSTDENTEKPKRRMLSRTGIKIVRKAKPAPVRAGTNISLGKTFGNKNYEPFVGKKKAKKIAEARETGTRIDIFNHGSMSTEIDSGFGGEEVVLLDFSDKNIYEDMMRQEQKRKEEAKKREAANGGPVKGRQPFRPHQDP